jgi:hypothetical protein
VALEMMMMIIMAEIRGGFLNIIVVSTKWTIGLFFFFLI